jgi:hypothetical protein
MSTLTTGIGGFNPAAGTNTGSNQVFGNPPKVYTVDQAKIRIAGGDDIRRMVIEDTAENITKGFDDLKGWAGDKILKGIKVTDNAEVSLKVADLNGTRSEVTNVLKRLEKATVKVEDIASEIEGGLDELKLYQRRLDGMAVVADQDGDASTAGDREAPLLSLTAAEFKGARKVLDKLEGALVEVELSGNYNQYQIKAGKNGAISANGLDKFSGEAHFLKFAGDGQRFVASSGDSRIDALLEVGKSNMWSPSADTNNKLAVKSSVENAADADWQQIMPGVFSLDETLDATDPIALTYGFHPNGTNVPAGDKKFFAPLDEAQKAVVRDAFSYLGGLMNIKFAEENLDAAKTSFQFGTNEQASSAAYAYMPIATTAAPSQIMLANNQASNDFASFLTGDDDSDTTNGYQIKTSDLINLRKSYGWTTVVHEIGHALGLKHPGDYNAGGGGASPPYLPKILDSKLWSVMSYNSIPTAFSTDPTNTSGSRQTPQTMMAYDIAALQFLYGKANSSESAQTSVVSAISDNVIAGDKVKLTIDSTDYEYTVASGDSSADVVSELADLVNAGTLAKATVLKASQGSGNNLREYSYLSLRGEKTGATEGAFTASTTITDVRSANVSGGAVSITTPSSATVKQVNEMALVADFVAGDKIDLTISGKTFSYTVADGDNSAAIATGLKTLINSGSSTAVADDTAADGSLKITAKAFNVSLSVTSTLTQRAITGGAVTTPLAASDARLASFQTLDFSDAWNGLQTVWTPTDADGTGGTFDASAVTTRTIIDMRPGAFSSVNRYNNIGLSFGSQYSSVLGGTSTDVIYAGLYSASITGGAGSDTVYLAGKASDYGLTANANGEATTNPASVTRKVNGEDITLTLTTVEKLKFYDDTRVGSLHGVDSFA